MNMKWIVCSMPVVAVVTAATTVHADEVQSIAAQVLAEQATKSAQPPAPPAPIAMPISGFRC